MKQRLNAFQAAPDAMKALAALDTYVHGCGLEQRLLELIKIRTSQINGCAYCIYVHTRDARASGETEQRIYLLDSWRDSPLYTERERAALEWTEALTFIANGHAPDKTYEDVRKLFPEEELVKLTLAIGNINVWNRFGIGFRNVHPTSSPKVPSTT